MGFVRAQQAVLAGTDAIARLSGAIAIDRPYTWARGIFLTATGKSED